jgi:hypothetical protein
MLEQDRQTFLRNLLIQKQPAKLFSSNRKQEWQQRAKSLARAAETSPILLDMSNARAQH